MPCDFAALSRRCVVRTQENQPHRSKELMSVTNSQLHSSHTVSSRVRKAVNSCDACSCVRKGWGVSARDCGCLQAGRHVSTCAAINLAFCLALVIHSRNFTGASWMSQTQHRVSTVDAGQGKQQTQQTRTFFSIFMSFLSSLVFFPATLDLAS